MCIQKLCLIMHNSLLMNNSTHIDSGDVQNCLIIDNVYDSNLTKWHIVYKQWWTIKNCIISLLILVRVSLTIIIMKYFVVFVLALIALFATVQSAAIEESAQKEPEVPAVDTDIPGTAFILQLCYTIFFTFNLDILYVNIKIFI